MKTTNQLLLAFWQVKRQSVGFRQSTREENDQCQRLPENIPVPKISALGCNDLFNVQGARCNNNSNDRKPEGDFIADELRTRANGSIQRILVVGRPTAQNDPVRRQRTDGDHHHDSNVDPRCNNVPKPTGVVGWNGSKGHHHQSEHGGHQAERRCNEIQQFEDVIRNHLLFQKELDRIRNRLKQSKRPNSIWPKTNLNISSELPLDEGHVQSQHWHKGEDHTDGSKGRP